MLADYIEHVVHLVISGDTYLVLLVFPVFMIRFWK